MMFTAPYIMAAPAMVNTSEFNLTLTRVQLLKSQVPAGIAPPDTQHIEIRNAEVSGYHTQGHGCPQKPKPVSAVLYLSTNLFRHLKALSCSKHYIWFDVMLYK